jgi:DNA-binding response OmpR family regulator
MVRVLVVDDEVELRTALARGLTAEGVEVETAADGITALRAALSDGFDVIVLDIIIPGLSGYRVLEQLRAGGVDTPVLLISAKDGEVDQADGFDLGADGYLVKPFAFTVLVAQVRALLRRRDPDRYHPQRRIRLGGLVVDPASKEVTWSGRAVGLTPREFGLLYALAQQPDTVLSKEELLRQVWGGQRKASLNAVEVYIGYLRRKLDDIGAGHLVTTARGRGYQIMAAHRDPTVATATNRRRRQPTRRNGTC